MTGEIGDVPPDLPWRHYNRRVRPFEHERLATARCRRAQLRLARASSRRLDQVAQATAANRVEHKVHALLGAPIVNLMRPEGVEHPALASSHVNSLVAASERDVGVGDDGNMNAQVRAPVIMDVDMLGDV